MKTEGLDIVISMNCIMFSRAIQRSLVVLHAPQSISRNAGQNPSPKNELQFVSSIHYVAIEFIAKDDHIMLGFNFLF
jgi:hypothetical protein